MFDDLEVLDGLEVLNGLEVLDGLEMLNGLELLILGCMTSFSRTGWLTRWVWSF